MWMMWYSFWKSQQKSLKFLTEELRKLWRSGRLKNELSQDKTFTEKCKRIRKSRAKKCWVASDHCNKISGDNYDK